MKPLKQGRSWQFNILALCSILLAVYYGITQERSALRTPWRATIHDSFNRLVSRQSNPGTKFPYLLRILPVGDSITEGWLSTDQNGYRLHLRNLLIGDGNDVDFIGAISEGENNPDNQHEGYGGRIITEIEGYVKSDRILLQNPNIILLMAGTNDMWHPPDSAPRDQAPQRLADFIDYMLCKNSDAVLFVAANLQLNVGADIEAYNEAYVKAIPDIVEERYKKGYKIRMVNFFDIMTTDDLRDGVHPTDAGYLKMGDVWYSAINNIPTDWITKPRDQSTGNGGGGVREECKTEGLWWVKQNNGNEIALGAQDGGDTGLLKDAEPWFNWEWQDFGKAAAGVGHNGSEIYYGDLDGDGFADYIWLVPTNGALVAWQNLGGTGAYAPWNNAGIIAEGTGTAYGVTFADLNGDKKVDYIVLRDDGTIQAFLNYGQIGSGEFWWPELQQPKFAPGGTTAHNVLFADLNGDGRKDLLIIRDGGKTDGYIQTGNLLDDSFAWQVCEGVFQFSSGPPVFAADIDGDGRDDIFSIQDGGGETYGWLNIPGGGPCGIEFIPMDGISPVAIGRNVETEGHDELRMADFDGDGKADFLAVNVADGSVEGYLQRGVRSNITQMHGRGAGVRLADMNGDGLDDYIMVGPDTSAIGFFNGGYNENGDLIWPSMNNGNPIALGVLGEIPGTGRHQIHFADLNADGLADYLVVKEETGAVYAYYNNGKQDGGWIEKGKVAEGPPYYGGSPGEGVRFADLDGDGRDDYLWLDEKGAMLGFLNLPGGTDDTPRWQPLNSFNPIALGVGAKREYVQIVDINGDGKADYLYVHPEQGAIDVWWNGGPSTVDASWQWISGGRIAEGVGFGGLNIKFGRLTKTGRYDYLAVNTDTGGLVMYQNGCVPGDVVGTKPNGGGGGGADDPNNATCVNPPEPTHTDNDSNAPILFIPPPIFGEPIPPPGGGNPYTPPGDGGGGSVTPTSGSPTTTSPTSTSPTSTSTPSSTADPDNVCSVNTGIGLCADGGYPVYDPSSGTINCTPVGSADSAIGDCQRNVDANAQAVQDWLNNEQACCSTSSKAKRADEGGLLSLLRRGLDTIGLAGEKRADVDGYCPLPGQDPRNPPANNCYATFTCNDALWPNVCGNAKSGIELRGNTKILTFITGSKEHDTKHMYHGRFLDKDNTKNGGWKLTPCEAEEYPWGAGNPDRSFAGTATVRLIPGGGAENQWHAVAYPKWVRSVEAKWIAEEKKAGRSPPAKSRGNGIVFCVAFRNGFDNWKPESNHPQQNYCTNPYGPGFTLFNDWPVEQSDGSFARTWDPWFDNELEDPQPRKIEYIDHYLRNGNQKVYLKKNVRPTDDAVKWTVPPTWCRFPSPGNKLWDKNARQWNTRDGWNPVARNDDSTKNDKCADYPGINDADKRSIEWNTTINGVEPEDGEDIMEYYRRAHARDLNRRALTQGFLDPNVYEFMGCRNPTDTDWEDPCALDGAASNPDCQVGDGSIDGDPDADPTGDEDPQPQNPGDIATEPGSQLTPTPTPTGRYGPFPTVSTFPTTIPDVIPNACQPPNCGNRRILYYDYNAAINDITNQIAANPLRASDTSTEQFSAQGGNSARVAYGWADDQTGCAAKADNQPSAEINATLRSLYTGCNELAVSGFGFYGGGVVVNAGFGCVRVNIYGNCIFCIQPDPSVDRRC